MNRLCILGTLSLCLLLASCGAKEEYKYLVGFSQCNLEEPWRQAMNAAVQNEAVNHPDMKIIYADAHQDNDEQVSQIRSFLTQKIDLLMVSPNEAAPLTPVVQEVYNSGIPVVVIDRAIVGDSYTCFVGGDNKEIGRKAGEFIAEILQGKGNIIEIKGLAGSPPAVDRSIPMREALSAYPDIKIIAEFEARWLRNEANQQFPSVLQANENINLVYAHNDPMAMGAYLAAQNVGREKDMLFIGVDGLPGPDGGAKMVLDGILTATFYYPNCGKEAVQIATKILNGETVEKNISLDTPVITRENAQQFYQP
ncbi:MAG TPA: substrate-binding domain-containing protein [bacterium]|nr:substrate-binding domain-containing protein [bacterium]